MKKCSLITLVTCAILFSSCTTSFYQIYQVDYDSNLSPKDEMIVYEDDKCIISYDLWENSGNPGFVFFNKTDQNIFLMLDKSFFIKNNQAYPYYLNRTLSSSTSIEKGKSKSANLSVAVTGINYYDNIQTNRLVVEKGEEVKTIQGKAISYEEFKVIIIPPSSAREVYEYSINRSLIRDCDMFKYPKRKQIITINFDSIDTPIHFRNHIEYSIGNMDTTFVVDNGFYVSSIVNKPEKEVIIRRKDAFCGQSSREERDYFKSFGPNQFYIKYPKKDEHWKH